MQGRSNANANEGPTPFDLKSTVRSESRQLHLLYYPAVGCGRRTETTEHRPCCALIMRPEHIWNAYSNVLQQTAGIVVVLVDAGIHIL